MRVIIQSSYKARVNGEFHTHDIKVHLHLFKMSRALFIQTIQNGRRICKFVLIYLTIQHAKRITLNTTLTVTAKGILHWS
ncbi:hypothetical protein D3C76_1613580 [compost metagenome]